MARKSVKRKPVSKAAQSGEGYRIRRLRKRRRARFGAVVAVGVVLLLLIIVITAVAGGGGTTTPGTAANSSNGSAGGGSGPTAEQWVQITSWSGGSSATLAKDIRDSPSFTLKGGEQRVDFSIQPMPGDDYLSRWTVKSAHGGAGFEMIDPSQLSGSTQMHLDGGRYYLTSNTLRCTWTLVLLERR
jgi:hypothetical protein